MTLFAGELPLTDDKTRAPRTRADQVEALYAEQRRREAAALADGAEIERSGLWIQICRDVLADADGIDPNAAAEYLRCNGLEAERPPRLEIEDHHA